MQGRPLRPSWEYRFYGATVRGKRICFSKAGFQTKQEAVTAGVKAYNEYMNTGTVFKDVGISYTDDIDLAKSIMRKAFEEEPRVLKNKPIDLLLDSLGESSVKLEVRGWTTIEDHFTTMWDLTERIKKDFDAAGITIAFNQLDVHMIHENTKLEEKNG
jgi:small-conductance mechanosensitive channel